MHAKTCRTNPLRQKTDCLIVGVFENGFRDPLLKDLDTTLAGTLAKARRAGEFTGKPGETLLLHPHGVLPTTRILLTGLGSRRDSNPGRLRQAAATAGCLLRKSSLRTLTCALPLLDLPRTSLETRVRATAEGLLLSGYRFDRYQSKEKTRQETAQPTISLLVGTSTEQATATQAITDTLKLMRGVFLARDLVNEPGNIKSPAFLADQARSIAEETGMSCNVMGREALREKGFGALLGVAQGSEREPFLITLEYQGRADGQKPVALVGKGVVFDAGGISLKPAEKMDEMKMDMAGAATVLGTMLTAALLELPVNLVAVVPAVENMPSGTAIRPGDILTSLSGQTIEVLNTDAEGRMILADALTYVQGFDPSQVIDLATLTGACIIALGHQATAVLGNDERLIAALRKAGEQSGERLWPLPLWDEYNEQIKSSVADLKNTGGRPAGTITAAAFLSKFTKDMRWAHLDIAGTAWRSTAVAEGPAGATGVGVRLLTDFLRQQT